MISFRPLPVMTAFALAALAILVWLGMWQLSRADEKRAEILAYRARAGAPPYQTLAEPVCEVGLDALGRLAVAPQPVSEARARFYGFREGVPGWALLGLVRRPVCEDDADGARYLIAELGFEPLHGAPSGAEASLRLSAPPRAGMFDPANNAERAEYYRFEIEDLAQALSVPASDIDPALWLRTPGDDLPARLAEMPPERHYGYALTWFGIAVTLIAVYFGFHAREGRLRLRR